ncbi:NAD(P)-binding domain-containing protein [Peribacillus kribbensis]|uniref:NAD(P)-binding domain-containing protein n=1 Tax=Peribacillus kribbensis TaxID=356658 RepID=UPI00041F4942|nr:NAD(P)-binding domain-containing protein [Peribacillus kribbensis]
MNKIEQQVLPVAIIGGGPVGLAAAAQLLGKGEEFILFESGSSIGSSVLEWGHVRMFSPWQYNMDRAAKELLLKSEWSPPNDEELPTGGELVNDYLLPLSHLPEMKTKIYLNAKVVGVARKGFDKLKTAQRENAPFQVYVEIEGNAKVFEARAVIDSSGTWRRPNPILSNGIWTKAEKILEDRIYYGIPNVKDLESRYKNKAVMVIGSGHSAINALLELADLKGEFPDTQIYWTMRKTKVQDVYGGQENDGLPARGELGIRIQKLVDANQINILTPFYIHRVSETAGKISVVGDLKGEEVSIKEVDELIVSTGFRPDTSFLQELRLSTDPAVESVMALAPLIDPNVHSCGTVRPHGEAELRQPEKNFYIVGMKSYGRAPTFLLATGYEQVRSVVAYLTGDFEGAKEVQLELPETGVCNTNIATSCCDSSSSAEQTSSCCGVPVKLEISRSSCC